MTWTWNAARAVLCAIVVPALLVGCGGEGISGSALAECINASGGGREALFERNDLLVFDTVEVRTADDNRARIDLWDDTDRAKESHERYRFANDPEERARFKLVDNAEVTSDEVPSADDDAAITRCLEDS